MHKIYIVLTYTGSFLARIVRGYTRKEFSHVSISLDKNLNEMYSFGRLNPYNPFIGGFVQESPKYGTFKRFSKTITKIYSLEVSEEQYNKISSVIKSFSNNRNYYQFNTLGLFAVPFHLKICKDKKFYCAEFVKYVLDCSDLDVDLPEIVKPNDFVRLKGLKEIYSGMLSEYKT